MIQLKTLNFKFLKYVTKKYLKNCPHLKIKCFQKKKTQKLSILKQLQVKKIRFKKNKIEKIQFNLKLNHIMFHNSSLLIIIIC